jgi:O-antigen ligase
MPPRFWQRMGTITASDDTRDESQLGRLHFWQVGIVMANANPLTGVGFDGYQKSYEKYNSGDDTFTGPRAAHSIWFGTLADLGYPGVCLFTVILLTGFWSSWRARTLAARVPTLHDVAAYGDAIGASLLAYTVAGTFLASQYNEMYWHVVGLSTAVYLIALKETAPARAATAPMRIPRPAPALMPQPS